MSKRQFAFITLFVLLCCGWMRGQQASEEPVGFGCEDGAVDADVDRQPALKFVPISQIPVDSYADPSRRFEINDGAHTGMVQFVLGATLPELPVGRASTATLTVYAITSADKSDRTGERTWQLVSTATEGKGKTSNSFTFDASKIGGCFSQNDNPQCKFANIAWATRDGTPIFDLSFTEDEGGANANNWSTAHILLDFRSLPPRVLASADCGYNEGGGACTALDSGQATRSGIECAWDSKKKDFACAETMSDKGAHRDFFLLGDAHAPPRQNEVSTIADAVARLASDAKAKVSVQGIGFVHLITRVQKTPTTSIVVLCAADVDGGVRFFLVPETNGKLQESITLVPHPVFADKPKAETADQGKPQGPPWTVDREISVSNRTIYEDRDLTVAQVVIGNVSAQTAVYWIGVSKSGAVNDAVVVSGDDSPDYIGCGRFQTSPSVVRVIRTSKPFKASVQLQPRTIVSDTDQPITWDTDETGEPTQNCLRPGEIRWTSKGFVGSVDDKPCSQFADPRYLKIDEAGNVALTKNPAP